MNEKEAWQAIYNWMMFDLRPLLGGSQYAPPEMAFPKEVYQAMLRLNDAYKPTSFASQLLGEDKPEPPRK